MTKMPLRVLTIAPGGHFLETLARKVLDGFPLEANQPRPPLSAWTILVPTRRAARELAKIFLTLSGHTSIILPRIKPIGDIDEDAIELSDHEFELPEAISRTGQTLTLFALIKTWAAENPHIALAKEIADSSAQSLGLVKSLVKLVDQVETEEIGLENIAAAYEADLSEHRGAILSLLSLIQSALPKKLIEDNLLGHSARRSRLIRLQAQQIAATPSKGPLIAAGSTGTIPATRALLKAIASDPQGAVVLPGLDQILDDAAWSMIGPDHPQFSLKTLISEMGITRGDVVAAGAENSHRNLLSSELMRPAMTSEIWHKKLFDKDIEMKNAVQNMHLIEARDRHIEARAIALILRQSLELSGQTAALVTPDRDLAGKVKAELLRWNIEIDDSAGTPLTQFGLAALLKLLLEALRDGLTPASLLSLLHHPDCDLGMARESLLVGLQQLEMAVFRNYGAHAGLEGLRVAFERAVIARKNSDRVHPLVANLKEDDWLAMQALVLRVIAVIEPLTTKQDAPLDIHLGNIQSCLSALASTIDFDIEENQMAMQVLDELAHESFRLPPTDFSTASLILLNALETETLRQSRNTHPRLAIYGVLEARLMPADILILGGLNETKWPGQPDAGPWLNRTMRDIFGMQQPEREIGLSAHDFAQGLGYQNIYVTWSGRIEGTPVIPSRWILRLQAVLRAAKLDPNMIADTSWTDLAEALDESDVLQPISKPKPKPPVTNRPKRFSVTEVEKLIRDPYAVYAKKILRLEPLVPLARGPDAALRGTLFHAAINDWNRQQPKALRSDNLALLLAAGERAFKPFMADPEISSFWWPRFVKMANWLSENEITYRDGVERVEAECSGILEFDIAGIAHSLYGRADRIDVLANGQARIVDYKSGEPPSSLQVASGLNPQLPLEAAILEHGKFDRIEKIKTDQLHYIWIGGGSVSGEVRSIEAKDGTTSSALAEKALSGFKRLLLGYHNPDQAYLPRVAPVKDEDELDYDHLSRFREWILSGEQQ